MVVGDGHCLVQRYCHRQLEPNARSFVCVNILQAKVASGPSVGESLNSLRAFFAVVWLEMHREREREREGKVRSSAALFSKMARFRSEPFFPELQLLSLLAAARDAPLSAHRSRPSIACFECLLVPYIRLSRLRSASAFITGLLASLHDHSCITGFVRLPSSPPPTTTPQSLLRYPHCGILYTSAFIVISSGLDFQSLSPQLACAAPSSSVNYDYITWQRSGS